MEYLRIGAAARLLHISEDELWELAERGKIAFSIEVSPINGVVCDKNLVGLAVGELSGYIELPNSVLPAFYVNKKLHLAKISLKNLQNIQITTRVNPFQTPFPNQFLTAWSNVCFEDNESTGLTFWFGLREANDAGDFFSAVGAILDKSIEQQNEIGRMNIFSGFLDSSKKLRSEPTTIIPEQIRLSASQVYLYKSLQKDSEICNDVSRNLDKLILSIVDKFPEYKPREIWRLLMSDSKRNIRLYDTDEIIEEISFSELVWTDNLDKSTTIKLKSFYQLLSRLKEKHIDAKIETRG